MSRSPLAVLLLGLTPLFACGPQDVGGLAERNAQALATSLPGRLQAEDYASGGEGSGYHDTTPGNSGGAYRSDAVDLQPTQDVGGGYNVGWVAQGEWLAYDAQVTQAGIYKLTARVASARPGTKSLHVEVDGANVSGPLSFTDGSGWQSWRDVVANNVTLSAGPHRIRVVFDSPLLNLNYVDFALVTPCTKPLACAAGLGREVFRDDFTGSALDTSKWAINDFRSGGGGDFTRLTNMRTENVRVTGGQLHLSSMRHCADPSSQRSTPAHPGLCAGTNFYSGAWIETRNGFAPGRGMMAFLAKLPLPVRGSFPALWGRNLESGTLYGELDLIEQWWDVNKGTAANPDGYSTTSWFGSPAHHTSANGMGPFTNLDGGFHVWEVEWDATRTPATIRYYYRDAPGATRVLTREVTAQTPGLAGNLSDGTLKSILNASWRPYIDFAVQPDSVWHVGPDSATTYDPGDLIVDSVIVCQP